MPEIQSTNPYTLDAGDGDYDYVIPNWKNANSAKRLAYAVIGQFDSGTITMKHGSVDGYAELKNAAGTTITHTASGGMEIVTPCPIIRFTLSGSTNPDIKIFIRPID